MEVMLAQRHRLQTQSLCYFTISSILNPKQYQHMSDGPSEPLRAMLQHLSGTWPWS